MWSGFPDWHYNSPYLSSDYGVLQNLIAPVVQTSNPGFTTSTFDLTRWAGQSVRLAFRATTEYAYSPLLLGVDNVMLTSAYPAPPPPPPPPPDPDPDPDPDPTVVPTPAAVLPGLIGMGTAVLRKRKEDVEGED